MAHSNPASSQTQKLCYELNELLERKKTSQKEIDENPNRIQEVFNISDHYINPNPYDENAEREAIKAYNLRIREEIRETQDSDRDPEMEAKNAHLGRIMQKLRQTSINRLQRIYWSQNVCDEDVKVCEKKTDEFVRRVGSELTTRLRDVVKLQRQAVNNDLFKEMLKQNGNARLTKNRKNSTPNSEDDNVSWENGRTTHSVERNLLSNLFSHS